GMPGGAGGFVGVVADLVVGGVFDGGGVVGFAFADHVGGGAGGAAAVGGGGAGGFVGHPGGGGLGLFALGGEDFGLVELVGDEADAAVGEHDQAAHGEAVG